MRIQHNIMAMSAYRNYNTNTSALSKNLEKLSSGYKINRAGDDAAGLAISEKMRAQITGLSAAQKNVKDGISLVKTAEGAMQEIQDMLNRMDYLATQSANGTYDNEVDRAALQKEVDQLNSEINRIADSANFNGIKLLDGTWDTDAAAKAQKAIEDAQAKIDNPEVTVEPTALTADEVKSLMLAQSASNDPNSTDAADGVGKATILETDGKGEIMPSFKISLNGITHVVDDSTDGTKKITLSIDDGGSGAKLELTESQMATTLSVVNGDKVTSADLAKAIAAQNTTATLDGVTYNVTADGDNLVFTTATNPTDTKNAHFKATLTSGVTGGPKPAVADKYTSGALTNNGGTAAVGDETVFTVSYKDADGNDKEKEIKVANDAAGTATTVATDLIAAINADDELTALFTASGSDTGIVMTANEAGANKGSVTAITVKTAATGLKAEIAADPNNAGDQVDGADAYTTGTEGYSNFGTQDIKVNVAGTKDTLASTTLDLTDMLKDGTKIKLGEDEYVIAVGPDSAYKDAEGAVVVNANATEEEIASALTDAADKNGTFTVGHEVTTAKITLKQKAEVKDTTDMSTMDKFASYIGVSVVDEDAAAAAKEEAIAAAEEELAKAQEAADNAAKAKTLNLQIGDTSDPYNQLGVKIGSMKTSAMGVDGLRIDNAEDAAKAIQTIKDAINYVSSVRGDLGAYQNRLEHTGNNLSVMAENIQDAESTIRDTDVAEEMMGYVKNNILVQSAQAMLAQANQVPQGVLQLLG